MNILDLSNQIARYLARFQEQVEIMNEGMIFTIEPMVNERGYKTKVMEDGWTAITRDGGFSAQYEHTILVTKNGCEVLTQ